ncbi:MAG: 50S ribosomal protein L6 [Chloroflexi bacterium]|nr:MAG: 50S ribosomal protein L6 [Phototrophicales bacterium]RMF82424.1 MAG: 50S ribosomal protein L6 [Chloroflexota bacterium]
MSRIGNQPIPLPDKVTVDINGQDVKVKGPKGELAMTIRPEISLELEDGTLFVKRPNDERQTRAYHGMTRALVANMVTGVSEGFQKTLIIEGVGFAAELRGKDLVLKLGKSHEDVVSPPDGVSFEVENRGQLVHIKGIDKQVVGELAANIRKLRPPEPYKGKGIRYVDEHIRRKAGKAAKTA